MKTVNWGILGTNWIAEANVLAIQAVDNTNIVAVAARTEERTKNFAQKLGIPKTYKSCEELSMDEEIDIIYISSPHSLHYEHAKTCLNNGKHVLCEKPFTVNAGQAKELIALAREKNLFIMEAMWTRFVPSIQKIQDIIESGKIGEVRDVQISFMFAMENMDVSGRHLNPELAGGALLDLGVYTLTVADVIMNQQPTDIQAIAHIGESGVDYRNVIALKYQNGATASLSNALDVEDNKMEYIYGTKGYITFTNCICPTNIKAYNYETGETEIFDYEFKPNGYMYQMIAVNKALLAGEKESTVMSHAKTIVIMEQMDKIRNMWGLKYPIE